MPKKRKLNLQRCRGCSHARWKLTPKKKIPVTTRPGVCLAPVDLEEVRQRTNEQLPACVSPVPYLHKTCIWPDDGRTCPLFVQIIGPLKPLQPGDEFS